MAYTNFENKSGIMNTCKYQIQKIFFILLMMFINGNLVAVAFEVNGIKYYVEGDYKVSVIGKSGQMSSLNIPETVQYSNRTYQVVEIAETAFRNCTDIVSVTIPKTIRFVGLDAFEGCTSLNKVIVPDIAAFCNIEFEKADDSYGNPICLGHHLYKDENTEYTELVIPETVKTIPWEQFNGCYSFTSIVLPNSVTSIGSGTFDGCKNVKSVVLSNSLTKIPPFAFRDCTSLETVEIPNSVTGIGYAAFKGCTNLSTVVLPNSLKSFSYTEHGYAESNGGAFENCSKLSYVRSDIENPFNIGNTFKNIGSSAILQVPNGTKEKYQACSGWANCFKEIVENDAIISFADSNVKAICITNWDANGDRELSEEEAAAVTDIGEVFKDNKIITSFNELHYFTAITSIVSDAFHDCEKMKSIVIPENVKTIGSGAFAGCSGLTSITIPNSVTSIGSQAFEGCRGLTSIKIPDSVISINQYAFKNCSGLKSITIPDSVTSIGGYAFYGCSGLTSVTIPNSVISIGNGAFKDCNNLISIVSEIEKPFEIAENVFTYNSNSTLIVPSGSKAAYKSTNYWNKFGQILEASEVIPKRTIHVEQAGTLPNLIQEDEKYRIEELTLTGELNGTDFRLLRDMAGCNYLGNETAGMLKVLNLSDAQIVKGGEKYLDTDHLLNSFVSFRYTIDQDNILPQHVFRGCRLKSVSIPNSVTTIGSSAFNGCIVLTSIMIPNSITNIGDHAFYNCI